MMATEMMAAGRELDAEIAKRVFGLTLHELLSVMPPGNRLWALLAPGGAIVSSSHFWGNVGEDAVWRDLLPAYSTEIAAAWRVVEELGARGFSVSITRHRPIEGEMVCHVMLHRTGIIRPDEYHVREVCAPLAICRAALMAMNEER